MLPLILGFVSLASVLSIFVDFTGKINSLTVFTDHSMNSKFSPDKTNPASRCQCCNTFLRQFLLKILHTHK